MRQHENALEARDLQIAVVTFEAGPLAMTYVDESQLSWPLLVDGDRALYEAYGMERGKWWNIWSVSSWWVYASLLLKGRKLRMPTDDTYQLGGDVLIDPQSIVRLHHVGSGPADRPTVESLLKAVDHADNARK